MDIQDKVAEVMFGSFQSYYIPKIHPMLIELDEDKIKDLTKATIRCIPLNNKIEAGACVFTGKKSIQRVLFAKAY